MCEILSKSLFEIFIFCPKIQLWFPEKIVKFCQNWIFGQKFDFSVFLKMYLDLIVDLIVWRNWCLDEVVWYASCRYSQGKSQIFWCRSGLAYNKRTHWFVWQDFNSNVPEKDRILFNDFDYFDDKSDKIWMVNMSPWEGA